MNNEYKFQKDDVVRIQSLYERHYSRLKGPYRVIHKHDIHSYLVMDMSITGKNKGKPWLMTYHHMYEVVNK